MLSEPAGRITLHCDPPDLARLMRRAGLALSAGGGTSAELALLGTPLLMTIVADNQEINGANAWCPVIDGRTPQAIDAMTVTCRALWRDLQKRQAIAEAGRRLFPGDGAARIAAALAKIADIQPAGAGPVEQSWD